MKYLSDTAVYQLNLILGLFQLVFSLASIYFVYRWGVTLLAVGRDIRDVMIGSPFNQWIGSEDFLVFAASLYLGFKFIFVIFTTARWEIQMESLRKKIYKSRIVNGTATDRDYRKAQARSEIRRPFS